MNCGLTFLSPVVTGTCFVALALSATAQTLVTGPSTTVSPYLNSHLSGVTIESILTVADGNTVPKVGGGTTRMVGIPDGLGAFDNGDGTFTLLMNHETQASSGIARAHGAIGSFVSRWVINKTTHAVVSGEDQIKSYFTWNGSAFVSTTAPAFDRMCSADLPAATALYNSATSKGTQEKIYFNGEETSGGRALAHVVTGANTGKTYHLPHHGYANYENVINCPVEQDKTISIMTDDSADGGVYIYIGTKNSTGATEVEKAGLVGGKLYTLKVNGKPFELVGATGTAVVSGDAFTLAQIGGPGYVDGSNAVNNDTYPTAGSNTDTRASAAGGLKLAGPEDGSWDTRAGHTNKFYLNTKGSSSNGIPGPTRLWQLAFNDIANPESGGTLTILLDDPDLLSEATPGTRANLDNMCFSNGKLLLQEDLGGDARLSRIYEYNLTTAKLDEVAAFQGSRFYSGAGANFLTQDEESSGIISLENILGAGWFAVSAQVHTNTHIPSGDRTELVEGGQLMLLNLASRSSDAVREKPVAKGSTWKYKTDGTDPGDATAPKWFEAAYDDSTWSTGATPIGYGDDNETATDLVQPATPRPTSYYFRRNFTLATPADVSYLEVFLQRDDGAVVYINGVEVGRSNVSSAPAMSNTSVAASTTSNEPRWVYIPVKTEGLTLGTTNTLAISVHQDSNTSSDIRMNCELIAYNRPSAGSAPVTPVNFAAGATTETTISLTWTAQTDAKQFQLERKRIGDIAWEVLRFDLPGSFTGFTDTLLTAATQYSYRLKSLNVFGQSTYTAVVNATTAVPSAAPIIFQEDFESLTGTVSAPSATTKQATFTTVSGITTVSASGTFNWYPAGPFGTQASGGLGKIVQGNNFGGVGAGDDWLILPPVNTAFYNSETFDFKSDARFDDTGLAGLPNTGPPSNSVGLDVLVSTNYNPAVHTNPSSATWTLLPGYVLDTNFAAFGNGTPSGSVNLAGIAGIDNGPAYVAFRYRASGVVSNTARAWEIDQLFLRGNSGLDIETTLAPLAANSVSSNLNWGVTAAGGRNAAIANNFGADVGGEDWLISPRMVTTDVSAAISFDYWQRFSDSGQSEPLSVLVSTNYDPAVHTNPNSATWTNVTGTTLNSVVDQTWTPLSPIQLGVVGSNVTVAFRYRSSGTGSGTCKQIGVDNLKFYPTTAGGPPVSAFAETKNGGQVNFNGTVTGGTAPFTYLWNFGDGTTSAVEDPTKTYSAPGTYTVTFTVTDALSLTHTTTKANAFTFTQFAQPAKAPGTIRVQSYNSGLNSEAIGTNTYDANAVQNALASGTHASIRKLAEVIQRTNPDMILLNEFDVGYTGQNFDSGVTLTRVNNLRNNYLAVAQAPGLSGVNFPYHYVGGTNTGIHSGYDLRNDGTVTASHTNTTATSQAYGDDAFGFGQYPGKYGFIVLSKFPINTAATRTFQMFLWK
ncbi:MAG: PKD domain-containing protein, partial [Roseimicrobium sp.]